MKISKLSNTIEPSLTRQLFNMAHTIDDVIDLTLGDPDLKPDEQIRKAACEAIMAGKTRYSANAGLVTAREVIATHIQKEYAIQAKPQEEIIVTVGGMEALFLALATIIDFGDEVIIPAPYYVNYVQMVRMCGGVPVIVNTLEENGFSFTIEQIEQAVSSKTVAIILNTPSNPTGQVLSKELLQKLSKTIIKNDLIVISDEVYSSLIYDSKEHNSILNEHGMREHTILIDSISKRFAMTGYRIGYAFAPNDIIAAMTKMQENVAACAPLPSQYAAIAAYSLLDNDRSIHDTFEERRNCIYNAINKINGLSARKPQATFYIFVNISKTGMDSLTFAKELLIHAHVAVAPGITYGKAYDGYIRIAFTVDIKKIEEAAIRIAKYMDTLEIK